MRAAPLSRSYNEEWTLKRLNYIIAEKQDAGFFFSNFFFDNFPRVLMGRENRALDIGRIFQGRRWWRWRDVGGWFACERGTFAFRKKILCTALQLLIFIGIIFFCMNIIYALGRETRKHWNYLCWKAIIYVFSGLDLFKMHVYFY